MIRNLMNTFVRTGDEISKFTLTLYTNTLKE
jgi:hypothetical protein